MTIKRPPNRETINGYVTEVGLGKVYAHILIDDDEFDATIPITKIATRDRKLARTIGALFTIKDGKLVFSRRRWTQREIDKARREATELSAKVRERSDASVA